MIQHHDESLSRVNSLASLVSHDLCDLGSLILIICLPEAWGLIFAGYVLLASHNSYPIIVYTMAPILVTVRQM